MSVIARRTIHSIDWPLSDLPRAAEGPELANRSAMRDRATSTRTATHNGGGPTSWRRSAPAACMGHAMRTTSPRPHPRPEPRWQPRRPAPNRSRGPARPRRSRRRRRRSGSSSTSAPSAGASVAASTACTEPLSRSGASSAAVGAVGSRGRAGGTGRRGDAGAAVTAAAGRGPAGDLRRGGGHGLLVDQLDDRHRGVVALARRGLDDPGVATVAGREGRPDLGEQLVHHVLVADDLQHLATASAGCPSWRW